uniref:Uncharacterized protein n=1 Tax=Peronospora matthiolae TaxID=2874970 RepID=A0AAV1UTT5_9STRA
MVSEPKRVATAAARKVAARRRATGDSTSHTSAAGDSSSASGNSPRGELSRETGTPAASAAGTANRSQDDFEIELINSGESDDVSDSKATPYTSGSPGADTARARLTGSGQRGGIMLEFFGIERLLRRSSPHASPSNDKTRGDGGDTSEHHYERSISSDRAATSIIAHADTNQEARDRSVLRHTPQVESP